MNKAMALPAVSKSGSSCYQKDTRNQRSISHLEDRNNMEKEFKTVARFNNSISAEITAGMLRENGIPAQTFGAVSAYPSINENINSIEVKVNAEDYEAALELLSADFSTDENAESSDDGAEKE